MGQIIGATSVESYHRGHKPWSERKRMIPERTYSGEIVYKRPRHYWTMKDLDRISEKVLVEPPANNQIDWIDELIIFFQKVTMKMLERILPFLSSETVTKIYYTVYDILGKLFGVDTSGYNDPNRDSLIMAAIERLAAQGGYDVIIRKKGL